MRSESAETEQMVTALTTQLKTGLTIAIAKNKALEEELKEAKEVRMDKNGDSTAITMS